MFNKNRDKKAGNSEKGSVVVPEPPVSLTAAVPEGRHAKDPKPEVSSRVHLGSEAVAPGPVPSCRRCGRTEFVSGPYLNAWYCQSCAQIVEPLP